MNRALLQKVRDAIAKEEAHFDQTLWWNSDDEAIAFKYGESLEGMIKFDEDRHALKFCGTPACIAGYAIHESGLEKIVEQGFRRFDTIPYVARKLLELTSDEREKMFEAHPVWDNKNGLGRSPTRQEALQMLDHAIKHNEVEWPEGES